MNNPVAESALVPGPADTVVQLKRTLAEGRAELRAAFTKNPSPAQLLRSHTALVDRVLKSVWTQVSMPARLTLLAVGGYGRGQLFPYSDVDVLFLLPEDLEDSDKEKVSELVGNLWDIGLEIGHSARSVAQCVTEAAQDITIETNLLEARYLAGNRALAREFFAAVHAILDPKAFFEAKLVEQQQRHGRFNDTADNL